MNDYAKLLMVILFWAGNYPFWAGNYQLGKFALDELSPLVLTAARAVLAAPLLLLVARASAPLAAPPGRRDYLAFVVLGSPASRPACCSATRLSAWVGIGPSVAAVLLTVAKGSLATRWRARTSVGALALVPLSLAVDGAWPAPWRAPLGWAVDARPPS